MRNMRIFQASQAIITRPYFSKSGTQDESGKRILEKRTIIENVSSFQAVFDTKLNSALRVACK